MGDGLKITKDKRHKSSSSLAGAAVDGTRSERRIDVRASIPEVDDQFATAEAMCDDLQEKIDLMKTLKRKRKLKKRSMTTVIDQAADHESVPFITVRTQPKKKVSQAPRLRAFQMPQNPTRGYLDPATVEQRRMIGQVRGYHQSYRRPKDTAPNFHTQTKKGRDHRSKQQMKVRPDGDSEFGASAQVSSEGPSEVACGRDGTECSDTDGFDPPAEECLAQCEPQVPVRTYKPAVTRRRHVPRDVPPTETPKMEPAASKLLNQTFSCRRRPVKTAENGPGVAEERLVVELFKHQDNLNSQRPPPPPAPEEIKKPKAEKANPNILCKGELNGEPDMHQEVKKENHSQPRRGKYRSRRYEMPTIASQMKQAGTRCYYGSSNKTNIPFVVSKSTAPSHNIGVNLQQVLNGIKTKQPLTGIPMTLAYHMGMGHVPSHGAKSATTKPTLENREINSIKVGQRLVRLPSYKYMSYDRLLNLYREGDGVVSKFLRANSRPHYFYTSMYNLLNNREDPSGSQEAKQSLEEYASLYREYEQILAGMKKGNCDAELERRRDELARELAAREEHIRKVVQDCRPPCDEDPSSLRATASTADDGYRHSTFKLNLGEPQE